MSQAPRAAGHRGAQRATSPGAPARPHSGSESQPRRRIPWLALVAAAYAAAQLAFVVPHLGLGWDETVYVSQVDPRHPAAYFSAPRSRGISWLTAPVLAVTDSTLVLRIVLALLSAAALYAVYRLWYRLLGPRRTALAALLFAGLWTTVLYGPQAMPNLWVALAAVAAAGCFLYSVRPSAPRRVLLGLSATVAVATLFRFSDGVWLALPLLAACVAVPRWRRPAPAIALLAGLAAGGAEWVVEAYVRWGGVSNRLHTASATEGGMGAHWAGAMAWHSLNGPLLCRPCRAPLTHPALTLWWLALPVLTLAACVLARRTGRAAVTWLPSALAAALAVPYLVLIDYSAPRFLLPAYALLALPLAALAARSVRAARSAPGRALALGAGSAVLVLHLGSQYTVLQHNAAAARATADRYRTLADDLHHLGLHSPCLVSGKHAPPIGYYAGCASANIGGNNRNTTVHALTRRAAREPTAVLARTASGPPRYARAWGAHPLPGTGFTAYLPLPQGSGTTVGRKPTGHSGARGSVHGAPRR
ncbi:glycosyltransferase family 39 protein [Streptomyces sp. MUSC 125]|uniref:glycosyltransferase family 39 protein n=1 Tax=Streptomyces sp. MUSC 125 TaxID=1428624 RepID=UPI000A81F2D4|nr:glycosyltransferase family 39 protein [Streptomyces sp. MUSC 125]